MEGTPGSAPPADGTSSPAGYRHDAIGGAAKAPRRRGSFLKKWPVSIRGSRVVEMSYLHCPTCKCAYNTATSPTCTACGVRPGAPIGVVEAIVDAAEQLATALSRANPMQLAKARTQLAARGLVKAVRAALPSPPPEPPRAIEPVVPRSQQALLATVVIAMLTKLPRPNLSRPIAAARALLRN